MDKDGEEVRRGEGEGKSSYNTPKVTDDSKERRGGVGWNGDGIITAAGAAAAEIPTITKSRSLGGEG